MHIDVKEKLLLLIITRCTVIQENDEKYTNNFGVKEMK